MRRTLTLEVAFPFKSHGTLWYARLMQELLRQWENTAELCSLYCQWARREEEGEQEIEKERESQRMRQGERANNVIPFSRQCCSQLYTNGEEDTAACASSLQDPERTGGWVSMWKFVFLYRDRGRMLNFSPVHGGFSFVGCFCPIAELFTHLLWGLKGPVCIDLHDEWSSAVRLLILWLSYP